jgi:serine/threonine protein kinase
MSDEQQQEPNEQQDRLIGAVIGQYTIIQEIGRGGMATVYSATQRSMGRTVAVKVLPPHFLHDPGFLERFEREVEVISQLEHPHILPIYDYGEDEGVPFIAMRYLGGGSMAQMVRRGVVEVADLVKPFTQIADALDYAHQQGIVHRDLKPGNIMLDEYGNAYLTDFGIARVMGSDLTGSAIVGTPAYMSPEQANGMPIDARTDIYALGIVLFELITGREPFQAVTPLSLLLKHINEPVPPLSQFRENVPDAIERVIEKATAKNPDDRYSSVGEMAQAFADAIAGADTKVSPARPKADADNPTLIGAAPVTNEGGTVVGGKTMMPATDAGDAAATPAETRPTTGNTRALLFIAPVVLVLVLVIAVGFALQPGTQPADTSAGLPTPFPQAERITDENYSISIPSDLLPANVSLRYDDRSDASRLYHVWEQGDSGDVTVAMALVSADRTSALDYSRRYYDGRVDYVFIDAAEAPDGTIRRSYRVTDADNGRNGQIDAFFIEQGDFLAVVELFTADRVAADDAHIAELQQILDSVRVLDEEAN